MAVFGFAFP
jgi:hypothetical protein